MRIEFFSFHRLFFFFFSIAHNVSTALCYSMSTKKPYWQSSNLPKEQHLTLPATPTAPDAILEQEKTF